MTRPLLARTQYCNSQGPRGLNILIIMLKLRCLSLPKQMQIIVRTCTGNTHASDTIYDIQKRFGSVYNMIRVHKHEKKMIDLLKDKDSAWLENYELKSRNLRRNIAGFNLKTTNFRPRHMSARRKPTRSKF
eukprot:GHVL01031245.1.p1 GENE.GHVL01031245.1~~GHVL01031245.1.p1  ORF type:complete len:131 (+),score=8.54 GHVL01031245.1:171-563(+)